MIVTDLGQARALIAAGGKLIRVRMAVPDRGGHPGQRPEPVEWTIIPRPDAQKRPSRSRAA